MSAETDCYSQLEKVTRAAGCLRHVVFGSDSCCLE